MEKRLILNKLNVFLFLLFTFLIINVSFGFSAGCCILDHTGSYCVDDSDPDDCDAEFYSEVECSQLPFVPEINEELGMCDRVTCIEEDGTCTAQKYLKLLEKSHAM